jgi:hypothetical protein
LCRVSLAQLLEYVAKVFTTSPESLRRRIRTTGVAEARAAFCRLFVVQQGFGGAAAAHLQGMSHLGATLAVRRGEEVLREYREVTTALAGQFQQINNVP